MRTFSIIVGVFMVGFLRSSLCSTGVENSNDDNLDKFPMIVSLVYIAGKRGEVTRSSRRLAGFRTICACAYILVVIQRSKFCSNFAQRTFGTCQFASSYASSQMNVQKIQPAYAPHNRVYKCVDRLNFLYIHLA